MSSIYHIFRDHLLSKSLIEQFAKYVIVGGINFVFGIVVYWFFLRVLKIYYPISFSISWILGVVLTFFINIYWVFKPDELMDFKKRFIKYLVVYLISYGVNLFLLKVGVSFFSFDPFWYQFFLIPIIILINFSGIKYWALKNT